MRLDVLLQIRVSAEEKALWIEQAEQAHLTLSQWIRKTLAGHVHTEPERKRLEVAESESSNYMQPEDLFVSDPPRFAGKRGRF